MYLNILSDSTKVFVRDSFVKGLLLGVGTFAMFAGNATIFHFSEVFINNGTLVYQDMNLAMNVVIMLSGRISNNLNGIMDYAKAKKSFDSIFSILDTKTLIAPSDEANINKHSAENLTGKIEFKNVSFAYPTKPDQKVLKNVSFTIEPG